MNIEILQSAKDALNKDFSGKNVVIIDVLRATTVMVTALNNGAKKIYPFKDIEKVLSESRKSSNPILAGERKGLKIDGFHFGNSPLDFTKEAISGKDIYQTTSNGTRAIENSLSADKIYIASFLNLSAISNQLIKDKKDTIIVCAGTDDEFSLDDGLCAGMIANKVISKLDNIKMNDFTISLQQLGNLTSNVNDILKNSKHYSYLKTIGYEGDLEYCLSIDLYDIIPFYDNDGIIL